MKRWIGFVCLLNLFFAVKSLACTGLDMTLANASTDLTTNNFPSLNINVTRNNQNSGCSYFVVMNYGTASTFSTRKLDLTGGYTYPVQIYKDTGRTLIVKSLNDASSLNDVLDGTFATNSGGTTATLVYRPYINPVSYTRFGTYTQNFTASLYQGTLGANPTLRRSRTFTLNYTQARQIDLSIVNTGGSFDAADTSQTLDFGNLLSASPQSCDLILQYNAGYKLTLSSANNGALKHQSLSDTIPYTFELNGSTVSLSSGPVSLANVTGISPAGGTRLPIQVTTSSASGKASGSYSDTITLTVVSAE